jgi:hypothetical protein
MGNMHLTAEQSAYIIHALRIIAPWAFLGAFAFFTGWTMRGKGNDSTGE